MNNQSNPQEQILSLPKGGGAIKGIGETFQPNLFTGTGNFSIPIAIFPGREGFGPQLALQYSSGNGNGLFGLGWQLSIPRITRKTEKGLPLYNSKDVFVMSGAEDLVPHLVENGDGEWVPKQSTYQDENYTITRYRPRAEGLFARIEKWESKEADGEVYWRATTKENITSIYGRSRQARIFNPDHSEHIFEWLLEETYDAKGNHIYYEYAQEDPNLEIPGLHEQNRDYCSQRYIRRIYYGNTPDSLEEDLRVGPVRNGRHYVFEVLFDYSDCSTKDGSIDPENAYSTPPKEGLVEFASENWLLRQDPFSSFRSGFEVRTLRRCQHVLMFHHFNELKAEGKETATTLVNTTDFAYTTNPDTLISFLEQATATGYRWDGTDKEFKTARMPPLQFKYSEFQPHEQVYEPLSASNNNLPSQSLNDPNTTLVDLNANGLTDILHTDPTYGFRYWENIGNGRFHPPRSMPQVPAGVTLAQPGVSFADMAGDGRVDLLVLDGPRQGFYETNADTTWDTFKIIPDISGNLISNPQTRMLDLTGDGLSDILMTREDNLVWFQCLGEQGYAPPRFVPRPSGMTGIYFNDTSNRLRLADITGDGLNDIVLIHNGRIDYWPNLGYGRFGNRITMACSPQLEINFAPERLFLTDIDGSGCADIVYVDFNQIHFWFNQSGNGWSEQQTIYGTPSTVDTTSLQFADIYGRGTNCLLWSYDYGQVLDSHYKVLDFCGGTKPYLLIEMDNNMGATTRVDYGSSTDHYIEDLENGRPWATTLPFPVQVVDKVEVIDHISQTHLTTEYKYHHGYYDGREREFRGFGMVEQIDTETFEDYVAGIQATKGKQEIDSELYQPPVTTRSWYHMGALQDWGRILQQYSQEYYQQEQYLPEPTLPADLSIDELHECLRAFTGMPLRQEIYSFEGSPEEQNPYTVTENSFDVQMLQPRVDNQHAVFLPVSRESITLNFERNPSDPRIAHSFKLEVDEYGNALKSCAVVYDRKISDETLPPEVIRDQQKLYITYSETDYTPDIEYAGPPEAYRLRVPYESRSYEINGISPLSNLFQLEELKSQIENASLIAFEAEADGTTSQKRLLSHSKTLFLDDGLDPLPLGQWNSLGLVHESYQLAFTPSVIATHYAGKITDNDFITAGYVHFDNDNNWWIPSGTTVYPVNPAEHFYLPKGSRDPLGIETTTTLDKYDLLVEQVEVTQATWSTTTAVNDYRILGPVLITDPNKNRSAVEIDALGMVIKTAIMGKDGSNDGDTLADPTTRMEYELFNWVENGQPNYVHTFAREQHGSANPHWQESYTYSGGLGEVALTKVQANPGKAFQVDDGNVIEIEADPRWIGNGRTILNNKGNPVKQYEPYFSATHEYEDEDLLREIGETPILHYDPLGRNIRTHYPNGTFAKVEFDPWLQKSFDANDTIKESDWYAERGRPDPQNEEEPTNDPERRAAWLAAKHANTPSITHFDSLGRPIYAISDYGGGKTAAVRSETDLTGRFSKLFDQLQREVASGFTGMAGQPIQSKSAEKGERWTFQNVLGAMVKTWDEYGREFRMAYDNLHRPLSAFVSEDGGETEILFNYLVYGDRHPDAEALNLLGVPCQIFDQAGMVRVPEQDFKGNPKRIERILAKDYKQSLDWAVVANVSDFTDIQPIADPALEVGEVFTASAQYDALNRPIQVTLPDNTVILPTYNEANFLASLQAQIRGQGDFIYFLKEQDYDAKGQRQFAHYGNDVFTKNFYDPQTFRLNKLLTHRSADDPKTKSLQNIHYTYDPVGNITQIRDDAQQTHYFNNAVVKPESKYEYDAIYQLIQATGREHASLTNNAIRTHNDIDYVPQLPHQNDAKAVRTYIETYEYDLLGNIKKLKHCFKPQNCVGNEWVRHYRYAYEDNPTDLTNRLIASSLPGDPEEGPYKAAYDYDNYGNMKQMPHLDVMAWNFMDQLMQADLGGGGTAYYVYGLGGQRMRKVIERNENTKLEWIYFGPVQIYRRHKLTSNEIRMERWTVHISDNTGNIAQVDTKTLDLDNEDTANPLNKPLIRYQYSNHLGSVMLETDGDGNPISYEEYHPFGTTSYWSAKPGFDISLKRFRFSGKERDNETGLYYFGARYYAAWLGRWTSSDPAGFASGANLFRYCGNNPIGLKDPVGLQETPAPDHVSYEVSDQAFEANNQVFENGQPSVDDFRKIHSDIGSSFDSRVNAENARIRSEPYEYLEKTKRPGHELPSYELKKGKNWILEATFQNGPSDITNNTLPNSTSTDMPSLEGNNSGAAVGTAGHGIIKAAPKGPTLRVPNTYDAIKLRAYAKGTVEGRIGRVSNTKPIRNDAAHKAGERAFKSSSSRPQGMAADHIIELQHDLSRRSGTSAKDFRWQDSRLNKSEGAKSYHLQKGVAPETRYGYVVKEANAGKWYAKPGARAVGRGLGGVLTVYGAYKSTEAVMDAASNDIKNPEYLGQGTAREVARQTAGWAGGLALGAKGAAVGAALGAPLFGAGAIVGGIVGGFVGGAIGFISGSTIADVTMEAVTSITGVERYVPSYAR